MKLWTQACKKVDKDLIHRMKGMHSDPSDSVYRLFIFINEKVETALKAMVSHNKL